MGWACTVPPFSAFHICGTPVRIPSLIWIAVPTLASTSHVNWICFEPPTLPPFRVSLSLSKCDHFFVFSQMLFLRLPGNFMIRCCSYWHVSGRAVWCTWAVIRLCVRILVMTFLSMRHLSASLHTGVNGYL